MSNASPDQDAPLPSLQEQYLELIHQLIQATLKGQIRSKEQVYQQLVQTISPGTGEIFERCLAEQVSATQALVKTAVDELRQAKATRSLRALQTIQGEWERVQRSNQVAATIARSLQQLLAAPVEQILATVVQILDPNQPDAFSLDQLRQLAHQLQRANPQDEATAAELQQIAQGLIAGCQSWQRLEGSLISWIYESAQTSLGFAGLPNQQGPWAVWAKQVEQPLPQSLFQTLALGQSLLEWVRQHGHFQLSDWVELILLLQLLQRGLVSWFDQQAYNPKVGPKLSISTFLTFVSLWCELANIMAQVATIDSSRRERLADSCFQVTLQILRTFTQRPYFPLYGGVFAALSGGYLQTALNYLDVPLRQIEGTQEKARILTLLGYSQYALGRYEQAIAFQEQALAIARTATDIPCEIANLNHLSRNSIAQKRYAQAIDYSQRALLLSRQTGERQGEANALANLGYSEVLSAQQLESAEPETYEMAIHYLQSGLKLSEQLGDAQSQALCQSSLGVAHRTLGQPQVALGYLEAGVQTATVSGDIYLQGLNLANLAEVYRDLEQVEPAVYAASLGMYLLNQIAAPEWRQPAGLLAILRGQLGLEAFQTVLEHYRTQLIAMIGVDGYDYLPQLLEQYLL